MLERSSRGQFARRSTRTKADRLVDLFDGVSRLAEAIGENKSVVSRWGSFSAQGKRGLVPSRFNLRILEAADRLGIDRSAVSECLEDHVCPCCGRTLEPGEDVHLPKR